MRESEEHSAQTKGRVKDLKSITNETRKEVVLRLSSKAESEGQFLHAANMLSKAVDHGILKPSQVADHLIRHADGEAQNGRYANASSVLRMGTDIGAFSEEHADDFRRNIEQAATEGTRKTVVASSIMATAVKAGILQPAEVREKLIQYANKRANLEMFADAHSILRNGAESGILSDRDEEVFERIAQMAEASSTQKRAAENIRRTFEELKSKKS